MAEIKFPIEKCYMRPVVTKVFWESERSTAEALVKDNLRRWASRQDAEIIESTFAIREMPRDLNDNLLADDEIRLHVSARAIRRNKSAQD